MRQQDWMQMLYRMIQAGTLLLAMSHWATVGMAETIYLKNGQKIEGDIVEGTRS